MVAFCIRLYRYLERHKVHLYGSLVFLSVLFAGGLTRLRFNEDIADFLPSDKENERIQYAYSHIGAANKIVINVTLRTPSEDAAADRYLLMDVVDSLAARLSDPSNSAHIQSIQYKVDQAHVLEITRFVTENMPLLLDEHHYARMDSILQPDALAEQLAGSKRLLLSTSGMVLSPIFPLDPLWLSSPLLSSLQGFQLNDQFTTFDDYLFDAQGREAVITVESRYPQSDTAHNKYVIAAIDAAIDAVVTPEVVIEPFGSTYIAQTNASQIKRDSIISILIAVTFILLLILLYYRDIKALLLIGAALVFGGLFSIMWLGLFGTTLSLVAVGAGSIIIGIAANYPLHFLSHTYDGFSRIDSLRDVVPPLTTGNITTVGAFLSLLFISSRAMRQLGLFAALLLLGTVLFVMVYLPHFTATRRQNGLRFGAFTRHSMEQNPYVVGAVLVITLVLSFYSGRTSFETDLSSINYMTPVQKARMGKMLAQTQGSEHLLYVVNSGGTMEEALQGYEATQSLLDSFTTSGIGGYVPSQHLQEARITRWNAFWDTHRDQTIHTLDSVGKVLGFAPHAFDPFVAMISEAHTPGDLSHFEPIIQAMAGNYLSQEADRSLVYTLVHTESQKARETETALAEALAPSQAFVFDSGTVTRNMVRALSDDFDYVLYVCSLIVFVFLTLSFGRIELSLISFLPLAVSWIWILGLMGIFGLKFNIINVILATFIFGMGDDYTIFMTEGMMYEYAYRKKVMPTYKNTVALSALIMLLGIGALIVARHPAMRSLAQVTIIGMVTVVFMAYIIPPFFFRWLTVKKGAYRREPLTLQNMAATGFSFVAFLLGALYLTVVGFVLLGLGGRTDKHKEAFHRVLQRIARFVIHRIPYTTTHFDLPPEGTFDTPSLIIANHQAHIDLMAILSLSPKLLVVTNQWAWHSPFYGAILRFADFLPMDRMPDVGHLRTMVDKGYSIMVFPEGTRSPDSRIGRFHKGAFYLAQALHLPITPVVLHGFGHVLPKDDLLLRHGALSMQVMPSYMPPADQPMGEQAKQARRMMDRVYQQTCLRMENTDYYAHHVLHQYIYKGRSVEAAARKALRDNQQFKAYIESLPDTATTLYITDPGQGEMSLMAALVRKDLTFVSFITDPHAFALASHCVGVPNNLTYTNQAHSVTC